MFLKMPIMKPLLYILLYSLMNTVKCQSDDFYDFLLEYQNAFKREPGELMLNEDTTSNAVNVGILDYGARTLTPPISIKVEFKLDVFKPSCLFSIETEKDLKLALCFTPVSSEVVTINLISKDLPNGQIDFVNRAVKERSWTNLVFHVKNNEITCYSDCLEMNTEKLATPLGGIYLSEEDTLFLGRSVVKKYSAAQGAVRDIKIFYNINEDEVCNKKDDDFKLPASFEEEGDDEFTEGEIGGGEKGDKGEKGDRGLKGEPGDSVQGPQGPIGPPGIQGPRGEVGDCKCSETVVSSLFKTMPEMRGLPGEPGPMGEDGNPGPTGMTGKPGPQGERGPKGAKGERGDRGDDGTPGRDGVDGSKGEPGKDGLPGPQGIQGNPGLPGPPGPTIKDTEVTKEISVPGPRGEPGPIGPAGTPGVQGIQGEKGEKGHEGLKGQKGEQGNTGAQGPEGEQGSRGEPGLDGAPGIPGNHGRHGKGVKKVKQV